MREIAHWYTECVTTNYESVLAQALELPEDERELLMINVGLSLKESPGDDYDAYWESEIKRRLEALEKGDEDEMDWDEFRKELAADE